jgi:glycosyltransferase involved in cell wall biosynthesis
MRVRHDLNHARNTDHGFVNLAVDDIACIESGDEFAAVSGGADAKRAGRKDGRSVLFLARRIDCNDGVASHLDVLVQGLSARGWRVLFLTGPVFKIEHARSRYDKLCGAIEDWIVIPDLIRRIPSLRTIRQIISEVKARQVSLIHLHGFSHLPLARLLRSLTARPTVATYHPSAHGVDPGSIRTRHRAGSLLAYRALLSMCRANRLIALSSDIDRFLTTDCRVPPPAVAKVLAGIDDAHFHPPNEAECSAARRRLGAGPDDFIISLPGRLNWNKGHDLAITAARRLRRKWPKRVLRMIFSGAGDQSNAIKAAALRTLADNETFLFPGYVEDMRDIYHAADVAILPSRSEGFALAIAEAMSTGLPVVRTPSGGADDQIIEGVTGFIVPFNDHDALTDRIEALWDKDLRSRMRPAVLANAKSFSMDRMCDETIAVYERSLC